MKQILSKTVFPGTE